MNFQQQFQQSLYDIHGLFMSDLHAWALKFGGEVRLCENGLLVSRPGLKKGFKIPIPEDKKQWVNQAEACFYPDTAREKSFPLINIEHALEILWEKTDGYIPAEPDPSNDPWLTDLLNRKD